MAVVRDKRTIVLDEDVAEELGLKPGERLMVEKRREGILLRAAGLEEADLELLRRLRRGWRLGLKPGELRREEIYEERLGHKYPGLHDR